MTFIYQPFLTEPTDKKVPFALPWKMVERRHVFAIVDANGDDVTQFSKNLLSYRGILSTDKTKEIDKPVRECAEMIVRCCNNHNNTEKYSADEALAVADGLMEGDAMAAAKTLAVQARFYFKEYEALRKIMASMGTRTDKGVQK
ncbi:MAG: hypothetical protein M0P69_12350 [Bacteroidales bacterium]|jgi:hypothetical protein|nr:hypothetical protein [Bacteroidales bacterium]